MSETIKFQRSHLLRDLKDFSFRDNGDFKDGIINDYGVQKSYTLSSEFFSGDYDLYPNYARRLVLGFEATRRQDIRLNSKPKNKPSYSYEISSVSERMLDEIPQNVLDTLDEEEQEILEDYDPNSLTESNSVEYTVTDTDEVDLIKTEFNHDINYDGDSIFHHASSEILHSEELFGEPVQIPAEESYFGQSKLYIVKPITQEILSPGIERLENELAFRAIVDPFNTNDLSLNNFDIASKRIDAILDIMKNGIGVKKLYDLR